MSNLACTCGNIIRDQINRVIMFDLNRYILDLDERRSKGSDSIGMLIP